MRSSNPKTTALLLVVLLPLCGCKLLCPGEIREFEIRHRSLELTQEALCRDYENEYDYVIERRGESAGEGCAFPAGLRGLALSGGGIRSATFSLGVLQALSDTGLLEGIDYMSAVSGGAYTAGWMQAHMGSPGDSNVDRIGYTVRTDNPEGLLDPHGDPVEQLQSRAGFLSQGGFFEGAKLIRGWLWRLPFYWVLDLGLHVKPPFNFHSMNRLYKERIEETYFRGVFSPNEGSPIEKKSVSQMNQDPKRTPYLIINANLVNGWRPRGDPERDWRSNFNFEFTRDYVGSDGLGYLETAGFDYRVKSVLEENGTPVKAKVYVKEDRPFRISRAVAVSGAAFDVDGALPRFGSDEAQAAVRYLTLPFNLNLGWETWNFARSRDGFLGTLADYLLMVTVQRLPWSLNTGARWIKITDGGHYDNTGVFSLVRRGVKCVIAIDAIADSSYRRSEWARLEKLFKRELKLSWHEEPIHDRAAYRVELRSEENATVSTILFLKPNADLEGGLPHLDPSGKDDEERRRIEMIHGYRKYGSCTKQDKDASDLTDFPHTSTLIQSYDYERFEAYRVLGYQMAVTYLRDDGVCQLVAPEGLTQTGQPGT